MALIGKSGGIGGFPIVLSTGPLSASERKQFVLSGVLATLCVDSGTTQ